MLDVTLYLIIQISFVVETQGPGTACLKVGVVSHAKRKAWKL